MKLLISLIFLSLSLVANIEIKQNIKALYHNVELTENEENYILDNQEKNIQRLQSQILKVNAKFKNKVIRQKNVVEFRLHKNGTKSNYKFLSRSDKRNIDNTTKQIIEKTEFIKPSEEVSMRYIFVYEFGQITTQYSDNSIRNNTNKTPYFQNIERGTTRFDYTTTEYVRVFETSMDGFANIKNNMCANMQLLTFKNQRIHAGYSWWNLNAEIKKGKYKLLIQTKKDCDINIQYP
jgi:hypothetical protein